MYRNRVNEEIVDDPVYLADSRGRLEAISRADALDRARKEGIDLVRLDEDEPRRPKIMPVCLLLPLEHPVRWEHLDRKASSGSDPDFDSKLWFETAHCAGRHYVLGNAHTFPGRISAWCPTKKAFFAVSKGEIQSSSSETEYFLQGFLAGQEPDRPLDEAGDLPQPDDPDYQVWAEATDLFRETGYWNSGFRICETCQARLLPSNPATVCREGHEKSVGSDSADV